MGQPCSQSPRVILNSLIFSTWLSSTGSDYIIYIFTPNTPGPSSESVLSFSNDMPAFLLQISLLFNPSSLSARNADNNHCRKPSVVSFTCDIQHSLRMTVEHCSPICPTSCPISFIYSLFNQW